MHVDIVFEDVGFQVIVKQEISVYNECEEGDVIVKGIDVMENCCV